VKRAGDNYRDDKIGREDFHPDLDIAVELPPALHVTVLQGDGIVKTANAGTENLLGQSARDDFVRLQRLNGVLIDKRDFEIQVLPSMEPPSVKFRPPVRVSQYEVTDGASVSAARTPFRETLYWGAELESVDDRDDRLYRLRVGVPHGGQFRLPLLSKIFTDGGIQNANYTDDNTTQWNKTIITNETHPEWDDRNITYPNCVHNITAAYVKGFLNATLCVSDDPAMGSVTAGSMA
jgi:hypothetical protein